MYHLKTLAKSPVVKYELAKVLPVATNLTQVRNYADHQIPERLRDVPTAKGKHKNLGTEFCFLFYCVLATFYIIPTVTIENEAQKDGST